MNSGLISTRYAKALYEFACQSNAEGKVYEQAGLLIKIISASEEVRKVLQHPVLSKTEKQKVLFSVFEGKTEQVLQKFIQLLFENKREDIILYILLKYIDLYRKEKSIYAGKLITSTQIDKITEEKLTKVIESRTQGTLEMEKIIRPEIIGGFILEVDNLRWDASISGQLRTLRNNFTEKNSKTI